MDSGAAGASGNGSGPDGGADVTTGGASKLRLSLAVALLAYAGLQTYANVASMIADHARSGKSVPDWQLWTSEISSALGWIVVAIGLWAMVRKVKPPRFDWVKLGVIYAVVGIAASALHVSIMVAIREVVWWSRGANYKFGDALTNWPYELRKDLATYALLLMAFALVEWLIERSRNETPIPHEPLTLEVTEGSRTHRIKADEIDSVESAGNYVELHVGERSMLHRATMKIMEDTLVPEGFVRIHRSALVRRDTIRTIDVVQSGDFTVELNVGRTVRGSRRYRSNLD